MNISIESYDISSTQKYIRWNNGLQLCFGYVTLSPTSWTTWGSISVANQKASIVYAKPFNALPVLNANPIADTENSILGYYVDKGAGSNYTINGVSAVAVTRGGGEANVPIKIYYSAIGTWK